MASARRFWASVYDYLLDVGLAQTRVQGIQRVLEGAENDDLLAAGRICWTNVIAA
jgi:hypothetical protein